MRVSGDRSGAREPERRAAAFGDALARARGAGDEARRRARGAGEALDRTRGTGAERGSGGGAPHGARAGSRVGLGDMDDRAAPAALAGAAAEAARTDRAPDPPPLAELAAALRALPPAVASARVADGPLALSFGRSLDVELRSTPAGIELLLRPEAGLARAAEAELPRVIAALRARGVAVARAEVRPQPRRRGP